MEHFQELGLSGLLKPIYKRGDVKSPSNYRGITLLPIMSKIMTSILNDRLLEWAESNMKNFTNCQQKQNSNISRIRRPCKSL